MKSCAEADIDEIVIWSRNQRFLPQNLSKSFVSTFLLGCGGDKEKAKEVLGNYFYARQSIPDIFTKRDPYLKENIQGWKNSIFVPLKGKQNGCRVYIGTALNTENYDFIVFVKQMFMCFDLLIKNNEWENGDRVIIINYDKIKFENLATFTVYITRKTAECERSKYLPGKLRAVHNVHIPPFMNKIHEKFRPFIDPEDEKLIHFHRNLKSLHKQVNPGILPLEFGGKSVSIKHIADSWYEILKAHRNFFIEEEENRMKELKINKMAP